MVSEGLNRYGKKDWWNHKTKNAIASIGRLKRARPLGGVVPERPPPAAANCVMEFLEWDRHRLPRSQLAGMWEGDKPTPRSDGAVHRACVGRRLL